VNSRPRGYQEKYIAYNSDQAATNHDWTSSFDLVGHESSEENGEEASHIRWDCEQLSFDTLVAKIMDNCWQEEGERVDPGSH